VAESKVSEQQDVISRLIAEIRRVESMMTDRLQHNVAEREHTTSAVQLAGN